jgi:hypothetical protein
MLTNVSAGFLSHSFFPMSRDAQSPHNYFEFLLKKKTSSIGSHHSMYSVEEGMPCGNFCGDAAASSVSVGGSDSL